MSTRHLRTYTPEWEATVAAALAQAFGEDKRFIDTDPIQAAADGARAWLLGNQARLLRDNPLIKYVAAAAVAAAPGDAGALAFAARLLDLDD